MPSQYHSVSSSIKLNYTIHTPSPTTPSSSSKPKPWIILISGLGDTQATWHNQVPAFLSAGYTILTFDNRGVGLSSRSPTPDEKWTIADLAADLRSLVKALRVPTPYHVLGVSMGGMITQRYALDLVAEGNESELASIILGCTTAAPGPYGRRVLSAVSRIAKGMSLAEANRTVVLWCYTPEFLMDPGNQGMLAEMDRNLDNHNLNNGAKGEEEINPSSFQAQIHAAMNFDVREELQHSKLGSKTKVYIVAGEQDILVPTALSRELHTLIEGSSWRSTKGGHVCKLECPEEFNRVCLEAWAEVEAGSGSL